MRPCLENHTKTKQVKRVNKKSSYEVGKARGLVLPLQVLNKRSIFFVVCLPSTHSQPVTAPKDPALTGSSVGEKNVCALVFLSSQLGDEQASSLQSGFPALSYAAYYRAHSASHWVYKHYMWFRISSSTNF